MNTLYESTPLTTHLHPPLTPHLHLYPPSSPHPRLYTPFTPSLPQALIAECIFPYTNTSYSPLPLSSPHLHPPPYPRPSSLNVSSLTQTPLTPPYPSLPPTSTPPLPQALIAECIILTYLYPPSPPPPLPPVTPSPLLPLSTPPSQALIAECIFERLGCTKACFFSEASLAADAHQVTDPLCLFDAIYISTPSCTLLYSSVRPLSQPMPTRSLTPCVCSMLYIYLPLAVPYYTLH